MQTHADVLDMPIRVATSTQTCALGAAMCAAVAAGIFPTMNAAQKSMGSGFEGEYLPKPENVRKYRALYERYSKLGGFIEKELTA